MVKHTIQILQHLLQDFKSVSDHFGALFIKVLLLFNTLQMPQDTGKALKDMESFEQKWVKNFESRFFCKCFSCKKMVSLNLLHDMT